MNCNDGYITRPNQLARCDSMLSLASSIVDINA